MALLQTWSMLILTLALALAAAQQGPERGRWEDCLLSYAQIESLGAKTAVRIAGEALVACGPERQDHVKALVRRFQPTASREHSAIDQAMVLMDSDQKVVVRRMLALINRSRQD